MFDFQTWEVTLVIIIMLIVWGFLQERRRKKRKRPPMWISAKKLLERSRVGEMAYSGIHQQAGSSAYPVSRYDVYDPNDKYVLAAVGMEEDRRSFFEQASAAARSNEFTMGFTSGPSY